MSGGGTRPSGRYFAAGGGAVARSSASRMVGGSAVTRDCSGVERDGGSQFRTIVLYLWRGNQD
jgi:hypothetical protein